VVYLEPQLLSLPYLFLHRVTARKLADSEPAESGMRQSGQAVAILLQLGGVSEEPYPTTARNIREMTRRKGISYWHQGCCVIR